MVISVLLAVQMVSCAYRFSTLDRSLPGGYKLVSVPVFKNMTYETGIEVDFTNALIRELSRSHAARISMEGAPVVLLGKITQIQYVPSSSTKASEPAQGSSRERVEHFLPPGTALNSTYRILVTISLKLVRSSDKKMLWQGNFQGERSYSAARVGSAGLNTVNSLYNQSTRRRSIRRIARDIMLEAHNRLTEYF